MATISKDTPKTPASSNSMTWGVTDIELFAIVYFVPDDFTPSSVYEVPRGELKYETISITSISSHFALNTIPTATLTAVVGRQVDSGRASTIHKIIDILTKQKVPTPIKVKGKVKNRSALTDNNKFPIEWPEDKSIVLFDGYIVGYSLDTSSGAQRITLQVAHWLVDMTFSSAVSRTSVPTNPVQVSFNLLDAQVAGSNPEPFAYSNQMLTQNVNLNAAREDLWGNGIADFYWLLCQQDRFGINVNQAILPFDRRSKNYEALRALYLFEGFPKYEYDKDKKVNTKVGKTKDYRFGVPCKLNALSDIPLTDVAVQNILKNFTSIGAPFAMAATTLWDKLIGEYCSIYKLVVVPMIQRALCVPYIPNYTVPYKELLASDILAVSNQMTIVRPIRGVVIQTSLANVTGVAGTAQDANDVPFVGGYYESKDYPNGQVIVRRAPPWLEGMTLAFPSASEAAAINGQRSTAAAPGVGKPIAPEKKPAEIMKLVVDIANKYAEMTYNFERLQGRQLIIKTGFRLDIAPGSILKIQLPSDKFLRKAQEENYYDSDPVYPADPIKAEDINKWLQGAVNRVSYFIDAEQGQAYCLYNMSHICAEKEVDTLGMTEHPLYADWYAGGPLVSWLPPYKTTEDEESIDTVDDETPDEDLFVPKFN